MVKTFYPIQTSFSILGYFTQSTTFDYNSDGTAEFFLYLVGAYKLAQGLGYLVDKIGSAFSPSSISSTITTAATTISRFGNLSQAGKYGIKTYYELRKMLRTGSGLQVHYIIEQRFLNCPGLQKLGISAIKCFLLL